MTYREICILLVILSANINCLKVLNSCRSMLFLSANLALAGIAGYLCYSAATSSSPFAAFALGLVSLLSGIFTLSEVSKPPPERG